MKERTTNRWLMGVAFSALMAWSMGCDDNSASKLDAGKGLDQGVASDSFINGDAGKTIDANISNDGSSGIDGLITNDSSAKFDGSSGGVEITSSQFSPEEQLLEQIKNQVAAVLAGSQANELVQQFFGENDAQATVITAAEKEIKETDCYKATYYYPPNSYVEIELFSKSSGCMFSSGYMKISRIGTVGNKITVIQIGKIENDQWTPVVMGNMNIYGYVNAERQVNGDIKLATGDVAGDVFTSFGSTEACNKSSKTCLTITQKVDQNDMVAKYGLNGTMKVEAKLTEAKVIINMDLTGSLWTETQNMETGEVEGVNQTIIAGQYAEKTCNTNATPATFTFTIPFSLKIDCYCPKPGSLSGKGDIWTDVQIDCTKDGNPDALMRISYKNTTEYIAFLSSCGVSTTDTKLCLGEGYVSYKDQDLSKCGLSGVLCTLGKDYFKCNSTCTQCTNTILLETLSETLQDWAKKASQVNTSKLADLEKKLTGQESSIIEDYIKMAQELCTVPKS